MLWLLISGFFVWLAWREVRLRRVPRAGYDRAVATPIPWGWVAVLLALALASGWPAYRYWLLEWKLESKGRALTDGRRFTVHCGTFTDSLFDPMSLYAGHADIERARVVFVAPWCDRLIGYLDHPSRASDMELAALNLFTHELMHIRGERDEARTECQAVQRNARSAQLLGVGRAVAEQSALRYYRALYLRREQAGSFSSGYFSAECAPGRPLDEQLADSPFKVLDR